LRLHFGLLIRALVLAEIGHSSFQSLPSGEQLGAGLGERHVGARRMQDDIGAISRGLYRCGVVFNASAGIDELPVDRADLESAGVVGFEPVRDIEQLLDRGVDIGQRPFIGRAVWSWPSSP
jgi:hypothetical protein